MATRNDRTLGSDRPIAKYQFPRLSWANTETANITAVLNNVCMLIERVDVIINNSTNNVTVTITWADENSVVILGASNFATLADNTNHLFLASKATADFDVIPVYNDITITGSVSGDPGASGITADVMMYGP